MAKRATFPRNRDNTIFPMHADDVSVGPTGPTGPTGSVIDADSPIGSVNFADPAGFNTSALVLNTPQPISNGVARPAYLQGPSFLISMPTDGVLRYQGAETTVLKLDFSASVANPNDVSSVVGIGIAENGVFIAESESFVTTTADGAIHSLGGTITITVSFGDEFEVFVVDRLGGQVLNFTSIALSAISE